MFKFLHAADIHLDSPLRKLNYNRDLPAEALQGATRRAFVNLIDLAIAEAVRFVLISGDLYDGDSKDFATGLWLVNQLQRLAEHNIHVYLIRGNHDAQNKVLKDLILPSHVHQLPDKKPGQLLIPDLDVAIIGQGFAQSSVTEDLAATYPKADPGLFTIGLLHTSATGYDGHEPYAPCSLDTLRSKGYAYWALGHVHTRLTLDQAETHIVFPGNTQGRHIRETGPKGCYIVSVDEQHRVSTEFRALDVLRWERLFVDGSGCDSLESLVDAFGSAAESLVDQADNRPLVVRVEVTGKSPGHDLFLAQQGELRIQLLAKAEELSGELWVEKVKLGTSPLAAVRVEEIESDTWRTIEEMIAMYQSDDAELLSLAKGELSSISAALPPEITGPDGLDFADMAQLRELMASVRATVHHEFDTPRESV